MTKTLKTKKGFTLTELIIVIAIIGILAAVLVPSLGGYIDRAKKNNDLQEAAVIARIYENWKVSDEDEYLPEGENDAQAKFLEYFNSLKIGIDLQSDEVDAKFYFKLTEDEVDEDNKFGTGFEYTGSKGNVVTYTSADGSYVFVD